MKAHMGTGRSVEVNQSRREGEIRLSEGCVREGKRESVTTEGAPDSVRGLTRIQYPSRVNGKGCKWWLKVWAGTKSTVETKHIPKQEQK